MLYCTAKRAHAAMQAQKASSLRRAVPGRTTLRIWYLVEPPPFGTPGVTILAAAFPGQQELAHFEEAFHCFLREHQGDIPATASASGHATDDGQVRECLPNLCVPGDEVRA